MKTSRLVLALALPVLFCTSLLLAQDVVGKVVRVIDGDTIEVLQGGSSDRVRLAGIDCPEKYQPFGSRAKQATSYLAFGQQVMEEPVYNNEEETGLPAALKSAFLVRAICAPFCAPATYTKVH